MVSRDGIGRLLAMIASFDQRTVGDTDVASWWAVIDRSCRDMELTDARDAIVEWHSQQHSRRMAPSDLVAAATIVARRRAGRQRAASHSPGRYGVPASQPAVLPVDDARPTTGRAGADMVRHVLRRLAEAGQDPAARVFLGKERAGDAAEAACREWLGRAGDGDGDSGGGGEWWDAP